MKITYELPDGEVKYICQSAAQRLVNSGAAVRVSADRIRKRLRPGDLGRWSRKSGGHLGHVTFGVCMPKEARV